MRFLLRDWLFGRSYLVMPQSDWLRSDEMLKTRPALRFFVFFLSWLWVYNCVRCLRLRESASTHTDYFWLTLFRRRHGCICFCSCCCYYGCCVILLYINCSKLRSCVFFLLFKFFFIFYLSISRAVFAAMNGYRWILSQRCPRVSSLPYTQQHWSIRCSPDLSGVSN